MYNISNPPFREQRCGNAVQCQTVLLQPQCFQPRTLADLRGDEADLVTVEDELGGLELGDGGGHLGDLVVGEVQHVQLLQVEEGLGEAGDLIVRETHFPVT